MYCWFYDKLLKLPCILEKPKVGRLFAQIETKMFSFVHN